MTFDAWIAKMLDALKDESGGKPEARRKKQRNTNPVMIREVDHPAKKRARVTLDIGLAKKSGKHYADTKSSVDAGDFLLFARGGDDGIITAVGCQ